LRTELVLNKRQYLELEKLTLGAFAPLNGFMGEADFESVVDTLRLTGGEVFPLPVVLDVAENFAGSLTAGITLKLRFQDEVVGEMEVTSIFRPDKERVAALVYGTCEKTHPGVAHFLRFGTHFIGGPVRLIKRVSFEFSTHELTPDQTKAAFAERGWQTVAGFQTRNVPHRAHEYLQRVALEHTDGLFIQPLVGYKKKGDYEPSAILAGYEALIRTCFSPTRVLLGVLSTSMRYAGPREAVFHALIRRNYGCSHFIVGRDHAGVGGYYGKYESQKLARHFESDLGIKILGFAGPFYCRVCGCIATEKTCRHAIENSELIHEISGSDMRRLLSGRDKPAPELMRPEVIQSLRGIPLFVEDDEQ
jgi:sulfate adenylyltransferase